MPSLDKETKKALEVGESISELVTSKGWQRAKQRLFASMASLESISTIPDQKTPEEFMNEARARSGAVSIVLSWIRDIEGSAAQHENNRESFIKIREEEYITQFPENN